MHRWFPLMLLLPLISACSTIGYYTQAIHGHFTILSRARPVAEVLADGREQPPVLEKLRLSQRALVFAESELGLPAGGSYSQYANVERPYVVWNVVAAPPLSLEPKRWCFPWLGCVAYRGYFDRSDAETEAAALRLQGFETYVSGALAYSTLGWFDDPIVSSMLGRDDDNFVATLFHELAHRRLYVPDDSEFNEAFAVAVANEGVRRWAASRGDATGFDRFLENERHEGDFHDLLTRSRSRLAALYASDLDESGKLEAKHAAFATLRAEYAQLKQRWGGYGGYDRWMAQELNNAHLALSATYHGLVPAFAQMLSEEGGDLERFYARAESFGRFAHGERHRRLTALASRAAGMVATMR